mmetsp:Transcript_19418/g.45557  ORF Transcript_19418/g.45557 Transcript_19418/m.45557 type:complete len:192 (-) Transcript_19418:105-680(-)
MLLSSPLNPRTSYLALLCRMASCALPQRDRQEWEAIELRPEGRMQRLTAPDAKPLVRFEPVEPPSGVRAHAAVGSTGVEEVDSSTLDEASLPMDAVPASLLEVREEEKFLPVLGMDSAADLAYKAMDMLYGTTGIITEDYPFACICDESGKCEGDTLQTACKGRPGSGSHAVRRAVSMVSTGLLVVRLLHL